MRGRSTFTAALRPSRRIAGWAWASEAAATSRAKDPRSLTGAPSERPTVVQRHHSAGEVGPAHLAKARLAHHSGQARLVGEAADALDQILVGLTVARRPGADGRNRL